jgi:putative methyltransferase (TIGR04325 family)
LIKRILESLRHSLQHESEKILTGYSNEELIAKIVQKNIKYQDEIIKSCTVPFSAMRTIIPFALGEFDQSVNVLDFGGGGGNHHAEAELAFPDKKFSWMVVDTPELVTYCNIHRESLGQPIFTQNLDDPRIKNIDLIIANSSIQYTNEPLEELKKLVSLGSRYIYITRTVLSESDPIIFEQVSRFQDNGPSLSKSEKDVRKVAYRVSVASRTRFEETLNHRYEIQLRVLEEEGAYVNNGRKYDLYGYFCARKEK